MREPLPRVIGYVTATAIVVGTVIGSGVFKKASAVSGNVSEFALVIGAWLLVGFLTLLGALVLAEVAVVVGKAGGNYAILRDAYGRRAGFLWGWVEFWIIRSGSIAALATIFTESLHDILRELHPDGPGVDVLGPFLRTLITATVIGVLGFVNARGTKIGGGLQVVVTTAKALSLLAIALLPLIGWAFATSVEARPDPARLQPIWPADWSQVDWVKFGGALVGVFWAYHGWMNIGPIAEEVKNPQRNIPLAVLSGVGLLILLYVSVNVAYYLFIPGYQIAGLSGTSAAAAVGWRVMGSAGVLFISAAIMLSVFGSLNGNLLVGPRLLYAMGQDGLAPAGLSKLHPRWQTPAAAEAVLTGWSILMVLVVGVLTTNKLHPVTVAGWTIDLNLPEGKPPFDVITDFAMFGAIGFETLAISSIFVFRRRHRGMTLPYRCPLYPVVPIVYVVALTAVLVNMFRSQRPEALTGLAFIAVGAVVYQAVMAKR